MRIPIWYCTCVQGPVAAWPEFPVCFFGTKCSEGLFEGQMMPCWSIKLISAFTTLLRSETSLLDLVQPVVQKSSQCGAGCCPLSPFL